MSKFRWWMPAVLALLCAAAYCNTFHVPFIFDDIPGILENPAIRQLWPLSGVTKSDFPGLGGRPLISLSLAINYATGGYNPVGWHLFNLIVHFLNALLVFAIVRRALTSPQSRETSQDHMPGVALAVTLLWMLHPLVTESVTYVLQRTELLMALFLLLTLYCFIRGIESPHKVVWFGAAIIACTLGMGTKEVMLVTPLLVLAYDHTFVARSWRTALRERSGLYTGLVASWIILAALVLTTNLKSKFSLDLDAVSPWTYFKMQWTVVMHYLRLAVWPQGLVLDYFDWPQETPMMKLLPALGVLVALFTASLWGICRRWWWGFWGAWFFLLLGPTSSILPLAPEPAAERRMYLPLVAVITVVLGVGNRLCQNLWARFGWPEQARVRLGIIGVTGLTLALGLATIQRNAQYHSTESIWADVVAKRPGNLRAQINLGLAVLDKGRVVEAIRHFREALRIDGSQPLARCNLANALVANGEEDEAIRLLEETVRLLPDSCPAHVALADILAKRGDLKSALAHYQAALAINPNEYLARFNLAQLLIRMGQREAAITQYREALRLDPTDVKAHYNLANYLAESGRAAEAISHYAAAARLDSRDSRSRINLGNLLFKQGRVDDAIAAYTEALGVDSNAFKAHNNLAVILASRGDLVRATEHFREAARLNPNAPEVHSELAEVLERQGLHAEAQNERSEAQRLRN